MPESTQHKLDRIRPPRVQITYDVETRGSFVKTELPFVVGILADLSGTNVDDSNRPALRDRKYVEIDRDNFNDVMKSIKPKVETNGNSLAFGEIGDFSPIKVLKQIAANEQFEKRTRLSDMAAKLDGNVRLQQNLIAALSDETKRNALKATMGELKTLAAPPKAEEEPKSDGPGEAPKESEGGKS